MPDWSPYTRPAISETSPIGKPPTGEPYARKPPVRFGGRRGESLPDPYYAEQTIALPDGSPRALLALAMTGSDWSSSRGRRPHRCLQIYPFDRVSKPVSQADRVIASACQGSSDQELSPSRPLAAARW